MSTIAPAEYQIARARPIPVPDSQPVVHAVAGANALYSISLIVGGVFWATYKAAGGGRTGAVAGAAVVPIAFAGLWAFGRWYEGGNRS